MNCLKYSIFVVLLILFSCVSYENEMREIARLQNDRDAAGLLKFSNHKSSQVQSRFALACASVQDPIFVPRLAELLKSPDAGVRKNVAFALGQIKSTAETIRRAIQSEQSEEVKEILIRSLGKVGAKEDFIWLIKNLESHQSHGGFGFAVTHFHRLGIDITAGMDFLSEMIRSEMETIRCESWYALSKLKDVDLSVFEQDAISRLQNESNEEIREAIVASMGNMKSEKIRDRLFELLIDPNWRLQVNALQSLSEHSWDNLKEIHSLLSAINSKNEHVAMTALKIAGEKAKNEDFKQEILKQVRQILKNSSTPERVRGQAYVTLASLNPDEPFETFKKDWYATGPFFRYQMLDVASKLNDKSALLMIIDQMGFDDIAGTRALEIFVEKWREKIKIEGKNNIFGLYEPLFQLLVGGDMAKGCIAANALGDSLIANPERIDGLWGALLYLGKDTKANAEVIAELLHTIGNYKNEDSIPYIFPLVNHKNPMIAQAAREAYQKVGGSKKQFKPITKKTLQSINWEIIDKYGELPIAEIHTEKGIISVELYPQIAPAAVGNFIKLVENGFYNGLFFHRVVSNFVIQTGDPRGDGWGGSKSEIATEITNKPFVRGSIGMASAGKDTETSQFFICHSSQRHLDANYTNFGMVISGMDVTDQIQFGDEIKKITMRKRS